MGWALALAVLLGWAVAQAQEDAGGSPLGPPSGPAAPPAAAEAIPTPAEDDAKPANPDMHQFTSADGHGTPFKAKVVNFDEPLATLQRETGEVVSTNIAVFSGADQAYIRDWTLQRALKAKDGLLKITSEESRSPEETTKTREITRVNWNDGYKISITSRVPMSLTGLRVEYNLYNKRGELTGGEATTQRAIGSTNLDDLKPRGDTAFLSAKMPLTRVQMIAPYWSEAVPNGSAQDRLLGIWLKVYAKNGDLLQEWASSTDLMHTEQWTSPPKPKTAAARGAGAGGSGVFGTP